MRLLAMFALLLLAVTLLGPRVSAAPTLASLNVQVSDLPKGSSTLVDETLTTAQAAKADKQPVTAYKKLGLVMINERGFDLATSGSHPYLFTEVILMSSLASAKAFYAVQVKRAKQMDPTAKPLPLGPLGDQRFGEIGMSSQTGKRAPAAFAAVRHGRYLLVLLTFGLNRWFTPTQSVRLARLVDARLTTSS